MPIKPDVGLDFASALGAAMRMPEPPEGGGKDLPDGFPLPSTENYRVVDTSKEDGIAGVIAYDFIPHKDVFTVYRPWDSCARCANDIATGVAVLPDIGDYSCPHTRRQEYETVLRDSMAGKHILGNKQEYQLKDGTLLISVEWFEKTQKPKKSQRPGVDGTTPEPPL